MLLFAELPLAAWGLRSITWLVLWSALATMTVLLIVLLRTRWSQAKPWRKCAILSLWVHVLLGCVATTVRIVSGAPELGGDQPIRVAVIPAAAMQEEQPPRETAAEITPDWEQPAQPPLVAPEAGPLEAPALTHTEELAPLPKPEPSEPAPPLEAPLLLKAPLPEPRQAEVAAAPQPLEAEARETDDAESQSSGSTTDSENTRPNDSVDDRAKPPSDEAPTPTDEPTPPPVPTTYADRFAKDRDALVEQRGGSAQTERAVRAALGWLATAQSDNGGWDASRFGAGAARVVLDQDRRGAGAQADMGVSGLALLAFLGGGHTHSRGAYAREVARGLEYLRQRQRADGALCGDAQFFARMYCHSMATFAVCEALALTRDERLEPMAGAAVRYTLSMQHPTDGGWRYQRGDTGDTSQLGWQLMTLKSAQLAGMNISPATWTRVDRFLRRVQRGQAGGLAAYRPNSATSRTMTAEALFCRQLQREQQQGELSAAAIQEAIHAIATEAPSAQRQNLYFWYYATLALHRSQQQSESAAAAWEAWNHALTTTLLTTQQSDGSWSANTVWGGCGGRVYTTALSALCLEVYYRYSPADSPSEVAQGKGWNSVHR